MDLRAALALCVALTSNQVEAADDWNWFRVSSTPSLSHAIDKIREDRTVLIIDVPTSISTDNYSRVLPQTRVRFEGNGIIDLNGYDLQIDGAFEAPEPPKRVFSGSGKVTFGKDSIEAAIPQWWGATGSGDVDDTAAIQAALDAYDTVEFPRPAVHYAVSTLYLHDRQLLKGPGKSAPCLKGNGTSSVLENGEQPSSIRYVSIVGMGIENTGTTVIELEHVVDYLIKDSKIYQHPRSGADAANAVELNVAHRGAITGSYIGTENDGYAISADRANGLKIRHNEIEIVEHGNGIRVGESVAVAITGNRIKMEGVDSNACGVAIAEFEGGGACSTFDISNNHFKSVPGPIFVGGRNPGFGGNVHNNYIDNREIETGSYGIRLARAFGVSVKGNVFRGSGTEPFLSLYDIGSGEVLRYPINCEVDQNKVTNAGSQYQFDNWRNNLRKADVLAKNRMQFAVVKSLAAVSSTFPYRSDQRVVVLGPIVSSTSTDYLQVAPATPEGGMVEKVEIIDIDGELDGELEVSDSDEILNQDMSEVIPTEGYGGDILVSEVVMSVNHGLRLRHVAGCKNGTYKVKVTYWK